MAANQETRDLGPAILDFRMQGMRRSEIAKQLGITLTTVDKYVREEITKLREYNEELVEEMFALHQERLEVLYALVQKKISASEVFDDRLFKVAIQILERQAKLLALDKKPTTQLERAQDRGGIQNQWLTDATPSELIQEVESYGIEVPERFKLPATPKAIRAGLPT